MTTRLIKPRRHGDDRGWFTETYNRKRFTEIGVPGEFIQDNHAYSRPCFVLRGLHFQAPPSAQTKLVRCVAGAIWDVAVDIRRGSPTFGQWVAAELTAANGWQLLAPRGYAHGYVTLEPDTEVQYKVDSYYDPAAEGGLAWDDPGTGPAVAVVRRRAGRRRQGPDVAEAFRLRHTLRVRRRADDAPGFCGSLTR